MAKAIGMVLAEKLLLASVYNAAVREIKEECGIDVQKESLEKVDEVDFIFDNSPELNNHVVVYISRSWEPQETKEMKPCWFKFGEIPYDKMWSSDTKWIPLVMNGKKIKATVYYGDNNVFRKIDTWMICDKYCIDFCTL